MARAIHDRERSANPLTSARSNERTYLSAFTLSNPIIIIRLSITQNRNMSSYLKFGRLPLSTFGPEECALTVCHKAGVWEL